MAKDLLKFVNPKFLRTVPLDAMRRLLDRHRDRLLEVDLNNFDADPIVGRAALTEFFAGPDESYPPGLVTDLHQIAELGSTEGLEVIVQHARRTNVALPQDWGKCDPKHIALLTFLDFPELFATAASIMDRNRVIGIIEMVGKDEGVEAQLDPSALEAFDRAAIAIFEADMFGRYCNVSWYEDAGGVTLVVAHGAPLVATSIIEDQVERVVPIRATQYGFVFYSSLTGRLKLSGVAMARRGDVAEAFARCILNRPGFFSGQAARRLYTLEPVQRDWPDFQLRHEYDRSILRARIVEARIDDLSLDLFGDACKVEGTLVARDTQFCALKRLRHMCPEIEFTSGRWRIGHLVARVEIATATSHTSSVTVKIRPDADATFKRHRVEAQIMEFLRRNGFCHERRNDQSPAAAE